MSVSARSELVADVGCRDAVAPPGVLSLRARGGSTQITATGGALQVSASVEQLYAKYGPMVLRRCRKLLRDDARALDAMHDVFVLMLRHQHLDGGSSLLFRLATNVCLNQLRTVRRKPEDANDELVLSIAQELDVESRTQARSLLARLFADEPETTATIAVLHYLDGMTWDEVADEMKMSVSGVRKRARGITERVKTLQERNP